MHDKRFQFGDSFPLRWVDTFERRRSPRYPASIRLVAALDGDTVALRNISLQGAALIARQSLSGGTKRTPQLLELHIDHRHLAIMVEVIGYSSDGLTHLKFVGTSRANHEALKHYLSELEAVSQQADAR